MKFIFLFLISVALLLACHQPERTIKRYPDPYVDSFRSRNIKFCIRYDPSDSTQADTTIFNKASNDVQLLGLGRLLERKTYDSLNFITRFMRLSHPSINYAYEYTIDDEGRIAQECRNLHGENWTANESVPNLINTVYFEINGNGQITREIDSLHKEFTVYQYDQAGNLIAKQEYSDNKAKTGRGWDYYYDNEGKLKRITIARNNEIFLMHYFSDGLLDSTVDFQLNSNVRYRYVYHQD